MNELSARRCPQCGSTLLRETREGRSVLACHNDYCEVNVASYRALDRAMTIGVVLRFVVRGLLLAAFLGGLFYFAAFVGAWDAAYFGGAP